MRLYIVRHAESENNALGINHAGSNPGLSSTGEMQAAQLTIALFSKQIEIVFTSPSKRAVDTTRRLIRDNNIKIMQDARLKERSVGDKPRSRGTTHTLDAETQRQLKVELRQKVEGRIQSFLQELISDYGHYNRICIMTHGGVCAQLVALLENKSVTDIDRQIADMQRGNHRFANASITEYDITYKNGEITNAERIRMNDTQHMK